MSFLVEEEDAQTTLQVALAFIDTCDDSASSASTSAISSPTSTRSSSISSSQSFDSPTSQSSRSSNKDQHTTTDDDDGEYDEQDSVSFVDAIAAFVAVSGAQQQQFHQQAPATRPGKTKSNGDAVKRSRAKKKAETLFLKEQVVQLEAKLDELQRTRRMENSSLQAYLQRLRAGSYSNERDYGYDSALLATKIQPKAAASLWLEMAIIQAQESKKAQLLNAELKEAVNKQIKLAKSLEAILGKKMNQFGLDLLRDEQKQFLYNNSVLTRETGIMADLRQRVHQMNSEVASMFAHESWMQIADTVGCSSRLKQDRVVGPVMELRMTTPLQCSIREAGDTLWRKTMEMSALIQTPKYFFERQLLTKSSYQKSYTMILDSPDGSTMELNGTSYVQRFSSVHHDSYIWTSAIFSSKEGEVFREKGWIVASNNSNSRSESTLRNNSPTIFRGFYEIFCENSSGHEETISLETKARRELVMRTLGNRTRDYQQYMQNVLLDDFAGLQQGTRFHTLTEMHC